jgi:hypothetical protein
VNNVIQSMQSKGIKLISQLTIGSDKEQGKNGI